MANTNNGDENMEPEQQLPNRSGMDSPNSRTATESVQTQHIRYAPLARAVNQTLMAITLGSDATSVQALKAIQRSCSTQAQRQTSSTNASPSLLTSTKTQQEAEHPHATTEIARVESIWREIHDDHRGLIHFGLERPYGSYAGPYECALCREYRDALADSRVRQQTALRVHGILRVEGGEDGEDGDGGKVRLAEVGGGVGADDVGPVEGPRAMSPTDDGAQEGTPDDKNEGVNEDVDKDTHVDKNEGANEGPPPMNLMDENLNEEMKEGTNEGTNISPCPSAVQEDEVRRPAQLWTSSIQAPRSPSPPDPHLWQPPPPSVPSNRENAIQDCSDFIAHERTSRRASTSLLHEADLSPLIPPHARLWHIPPPPFPPLLKPTRVDGQASIGRMNRFLCLPPTTMAADIEGLPMLNVFEEDELFSPFIRSGTPRLPPNAQPIAARGRGPRRSKPLRIRTSVQDFAARMEFRKEALMVEWPGLHTEIVSPPPYVLKEEEEGVEWGRYESYDYDDDDAQITRVGVIITGQTGRELLSSEHYAERNNQVPKLGASPLRNEVVDDEVEKDSREAEDTPE